MLRPRSVRHLAFFALLAACVPPSSSATVKVTLDAPIVLGATATEGDDVESLSAEFESPNAPAGEYLLFASGAAPTSDAALATLDASACVGRCDLAVPGIGALEARVVLASDGKLRISTGHAAPRAYFVLARRPVVGASAALPPLALEPRVSATSLGGCDNPDAPGVLVLSLPKG